MSKIKVQKSKILPAQAGKIQKLLGFTMIELLIVIAVLGILAVAVLSAINPIEQINRGKDTGSRSDAEQLISAVDRSYTVNGFYPWKVKSDDGTNIGTNLRIINESWASDPPLNKMLTALGTVNNQSGELKSAFITKLKTATYNSLYIYNRGNQGDSTYVCFKPASSSFQQTAWARCSETAGLPSDLASINAEVCHDEVNVKSCLP